MKKAPEVLTRMKLSCCWGDNLNEKELNDVVDYINELEQQCRKQKEAIDKAIEFSNKNWCTWCTHHLEYMTELQNILKEVSE